MIWPIYLDAGKSLNEGRKISKEYAVSEPRIKEIVKATQKLRYNITSDDSKKEILINLSNTIKQMREAKQSNRPGNKKGKKGKRRK